MENITFHNPNLLYFLLLLVPMLAWYVWKQSSMQASLRLSSIQGFAQMPQTYKYYLRHLPVVLRSVAFALLVTALARPQSTDNWSNTSTEGIEIVMAIDISGSMLAEDFKPNRLEAAKEDAIRFISGRPNDKIGLVVFSGESFTQCPLTTDHAVLINLIKDVQQGMIEDGTAIGLGLANAVSRMKESTSKSRVVILMTDGVNNQGEIPPLTAAEIAKTLGIRVYTIGVGSMGKAPYPVTDMFGRKRYQQMDVEIDEEVLTQIAHLTDGKYFRAENNERLEQVYEEIDKLEKSKIEVKEYSKKNEEYFVLVFLGVVLLMGEVLLRQTILRNVP
ncbi:MAG: VWA domain-containing protein [Salinivirgaceae bacterium]|jgi:Ca-activated chloride channel family protein|nr:VWA domain-containing protein [Salinivirgaceae bacterium]